MSLRCSAKFTAWYEAQPEMQTCSRCKRQDSKAYVQPQPSRDIAPWGYAGLGVWALDHGADPDDPNLRPALCGACIGYMNERAREKRKEQLAHEPRCEAEGCSRRGTWNLGTVPRTLLCGRHKKEAMARRAKSIAGAGWLSMFGAPVSKGEVLEGLKTERGSA